MTLEEQIASANAKGYKVFGLHQRDDQLWQCTLHVFGHSPIFNTLHVGELSTVITIATEYMDAKIYREGLPLKKVLDKKVDSAEVDNMLLDLGLL